MEGESEFEGAKSGRQKKVPLLLETGEVVFPGLTRSDPFF